MKEKETSLSDKEHLVWTETLQHKKELNLVFLAEDIKEFIKRLLTPNNISRGFVEVSTIKYYAGDKLT